MIYPSADTIEDRVGSRYSLVVLAAKRAKQIKEGSPVLIDTLSTNPLTIALEEIAAGKVTIQPAVSIPEGNLPSDGILDNYASSVTLELSNEEHTSSSDAGVAETAGDAPDRDGSTNSLEALAK